MDKDKKAKPKINIPRADEKEVATLPSGYIGIDKKVEHLSWLMIGVVVVCFLGFITLVIDSFHINSATYKEYSKKADDVEATQKINQQLLEQNAKNQQMIIDLQTQLLQKK